MAGWSPTKSFQEYWKTPKFSLPPVQFTFTLYKMSTNYHDKKQFIRHHTEEHEMGQHLMGRRKICRNQCKVRTTTRMSTRGLQDPRGDGLRAASCAVCSVYPRARPLVRGRVPVNSHGPPVATVAVMQLSELEGQHPCLEFLPSQD